MAISRLISVVAFLLGLVLFGRLWLTFQPTLSSIALSGSDLALLVLLPLPAFVILIVRLLIILRALGLRPRIIPLTSLVLTGQAAGNLLTGGTLTELGFRTLFMTRAGLPPRLAIIANVIDGLVRFGVNSVLLFGVAAYFFWTSFGDPAAALTVGAGAILSLLSLFILTLVLFSGVDRWFITIASRLTKSDRAATTLAREKESLVDFFRSRRGTIAVAIFLSVIGFFLEPLQLGFLLAYFGLKLPLWAVFWLYQALTLPRLLPIPAGIGVVEEAGILFTRLVGTSTSLGFLMAILWRVRLLPYTLLGLLLMPFSALLPVERRTRVKA